MGMVVFGLGMGTDGVVWCFWVWLCVGWFLVCVCKRCKCVVFFVRWEHCVLLCVLGGVCCVVEDGSIVCCCVEMCCGERWVLGCCGVVCRDVYCVGGVCCVVSGVCRYVLCCLCVLGGVCCCVCFRG